MVLLRLSVAHPRRYCPAMASEQRRRGWLSPVLLLGGRYDYMIVLDADSVLSVDTLLTLVREMAADPKLGLLQTVPRLCGGSTLFARLQQFAGAIYGPIVARATGTEPDPVHEPPRPGDIRRSEADITLARTLLGYEPAVDVNAGMRRTVEWFRDGGRVGITREEEVT